MAYKIEIWKSGIIHTIKPVKKGDIVIIPEYVDGIKVTGLRDRLFENKKANFQVIIEARIKEISGRCFKNSGLTAIQLPSTLMRIREYAFSRCKGLREVRGACILEYIGRYAFEACVLEHIDITSVETIAVGAFDSVNFSKVPSFLQSMGLVNIENAAFYGANFQNGALIFPSTLRRIGRFAFFRTYISNVVFSEICSLGESCFYECSIRYIQLYKIYIIPQNCFACCNMLESIILPDGVTNIEGWAFGSCKNLKFASLPDGINYIAHDAFPKETKIEYRA